MVSKGLQRAYRAAKESQRKERINAGNFQVFCLKKDGTPYKQPHDMDGRVNWTKGEVEEEASRMMALNPKSTYIVIEK